MHTNARSAAVRSLRYLSLAYSIGLALHIRLTAVAFGWQPQPQPAHPLPAAHQNGRCSQDDESDALARTSDRAAASPALVAHRKQSPLKNDVFTEFMFKQMEVRSRSTSPGCAPPLWSTACSSAHASFLKPMCETLEVRLCLSSS